MRVSSGCMWVCQCLGELGGECGRSREGLGECGLTYTHVSLTFTYGRNTIVRQGEGVSPRTHCNRACDTCKHIIPVARIAPAIRG